jgi:hypothetical protein
MSAGEARQIAWKKSTASGTGSNCVEVGRTESVICIRDSKDPAGPLLSFSRTEWAAFLEGVKAGEFEIE